MSDDTRGFSTRAIRAASRTPKVAQRPTSVPIYDLLDDFSRALAAARAAAAVPAGV